ncbi:MAG: hypothetical protein Q4G59_07540 [Planctomycetia bacterium]|nr:hypothetical protein [Planctomycetia bacterium]
MAKKQKQLPLHQIAKNRKKLVTAPIVLFFWWGGLICLPFLFILIENVSLGPIGGLSAVRPVLVMNF